MNYSYEFVQVRPKDLYVQIRYTSENNPTITKNITVAPEDFNESGLEKIAAVYGKLVSDQWAAINVLPDTIEVPEGPVAAIVKEEVQPEPIEIDPFVERVELTSSETATQIIYSYQKIPLTSEEQVAYLTNWRESAQCTMRQARLALMQQNLLQNVNDAIAALPEPDKSAVETEWEYGATVQRNSPWIASMAAALGMTDEDMDNLFKLAVTL